VMLDLEVQVPHEPVDDVEGPRLDVHRVQGRVANPVHLQNAQQWCQRAIQCLDNTSCFFYSSVFIKQKKTDKALVEHKLSCVD
jgi:hypothetical protein